MSCFCLLRRKQVQRLLSYFVAVRKPSLDSARPVDISVKQLNSEHTIDLPFSSPLPNDCNSRNSTHTSQMGGKDPRAWVIPCCFFKVTRCWIGVDRLGHEAALWYGILPYCNVGPSSALCFWRQQTEWDHRSVAQTHLVFDLLITLWRD